MFCRQDKEKARLEKTIATQVRAGKAQADDNKIRMASIRQKKLERNSGMMAGSDGRRFKLSRDRVGTKYVSKV